MTEPTPTNSSDTNRTPSRDDSELVVRPHIKVPTSEFTLTFVRSSGPGGQNVNKVSTKACLRWPIEDSASLPPGVKARFQERYRNRITADGDFLLFSQRYRDQSRNVADCYEKLRDLINAVADAPVRRKKRKPTRGSIERRLKNKKQRSQKKENRQRPRHDD